MPILENLWIIPLLPLLGSAINGLFGAKWSKAIVNSVALGSTGVSFLCAVEAVREFLGYYEANHKAWIKPFFDWIVAGNFRAGFDLQLDQLTVVMLLVVTGVGFLIHIYSTGYMAHEGGYYRFFSYLNLFMFFMLILVLAANYVLLFVGWEGVGLCSYLLIGFYFLKKSASDAGKKAFIVNRIGDAGFILGILLTAVTLGTIRFTDQGLPDSSGYSGILQSLKSAVESGALGSGSHVLTAIALLLFVGAMGKSAQIPLYVWLPDAMEGPTPVSALIHAATMVTAGVYMVVRMNVIYQLAPVAMDVVAIVGAVTAIFAASMALVQNDIKKVLAYSTISQLGYMFLALGVGAFAAGIFHLMTHAFFKALLFLGAGSVIHAMSGEQDIRKMGGLWDKIPNTAKTFGVATLAIAGIFPFAGFFSKDEILGSSFDRYRSLWFVGFHADAPTEKHIHESPRAMIVPLMILAGLSLIGGWIGWPSALGGENRFERFLEPVLTGVLAETGAVKIVHHGLAKEIFLMLGSLAVAFVGIWLAYELYSSCRIAPELVAKKWPRLYQLLLHKYYVDEIYDAAVVERTKDLGTGLVWLDANVIDGLGVNGAGWLARFSSTLSMWWDKWIIDGLLNFSAKLMQLLSYPVRLLQTGMFSSYAMLILVGLVVLLAYYGHHVQVLLRSVR